MALFHLGALPVLLQHMRHESPHVQVNVLRAIAMSSHDRAFVVTQSERGEKGLHVGWLQCAVRMICARSA
jgi:hypothetical protein